MQGYTYSTFSIVAIAIHLIINYRMLLGGGPKTALVQRYRGFLLGVLFYYAADGAWGIFAGLGWIWPWYVDTILFFLSLVIFVFAWCRFVVVYLDFGKWPARILSWSGHALLAVNIVLLAANAFNDCFFYFDEHGKYVTGGMRDPAFVLLVAFNVLTAAFVLAKAIVNRDSVRRRSMMVLMFCITITAAIVLQVIWPLTPFTALGCLVGNCFFHIFVVQDEQAARHAAELEEAIERAHAADKARSMFFSIVSHDIRTPLNAILGYAELLQRGIDGEPERRLALESIHASGTTLLQLVNDVLDLAKMDSGRMPLHPEPVLLAQLTDEVFSSFWRDASDKGVELANRTDGVPAVMLDGQRFRQTLFNLIGNAVKFTKDGTVTVSASYDGSTLVVSVSDTGCGIPPDMLTHILDPFVQVQDPSHAADRTGGTGLGLSICRRLVEAMGGTIDVKSELGRGSTFSIRIPGVETAEEESKVASEESNPQAHPLANSQTHKPPRRVLVVDDSPVNRKVLLAFLQKAGIARIDQACDGEEALAALDSAMKAGDPHDFVFSDFWMPNMNGLELIERLRNDPRFERLPIYAVTADTEFHKDYRSTLFNGVLLKPITYGKLMDALAAAN